VRGGLRIPLLVFIGAITLALSVPGALSASAGPDAAGARPQKPKVRYVFADAGPGLASGTFGAAIDTSGQETTYFVEYGPSSGYGAQTAPGTLGPQPRPGAAIPTIQEVRATAEGLRPGVTYHYRVVARNGAGEIRTGDRTFQSGGGRPQISRGFERPGQLVTSVIVGGTIDTGELPTTYQIKYGARFRFATKPAALPAVPSPGQWRSTAKEIRTTIKGLRPGKETQYLIVAKNDLGSASYRGKMTAAARKSPIASVVSEYGETPTSAIIAATVDTGGLRTTYYVEYTRPGRKLRTAKATLRSLPGKGWSPTSTEVRIPISGLKPDAKYTYRLVVENAAGGTSSRHNLVTGGSKPSLSYLFAVAGPYGGSVVIGAGTQTGALPATFYVEYGPTAGYGARSPEATLAPLPRPEASRPDSGEIRIELGGIRPATTYHYRLVAVNEVGALRSSDRTFELK
jgi:fibronectin type III domain protein